MTCKGLSNENQFHNLDTYMVTIGVLDHCQHMRFNLADKQRLLLRSTQLYDLHPRLL